MIDDSRALPPPHRCSPPAYVVHGPPLTRMGPPTTTIVHTEGTIFHCDDCPKVWVLAYKPPMRRGGYSPGGLAWREEYRWERRKRLGLHWWQRMPAELR